MHIKGEKGQNIMCLAKVYTRRGNEQEKFLTDGIARVDFSDDGDILLTNIIGDQKKVHGSITMMDLEADQIHIKLA